MVALDRARILAASAAWVWIPEDAVEVAGAGYRVVRYPERLWGRPTAEVAWSMDGEDPDGVVDEVADRVRAWGISAVD